jgi:hypothetical protein
MGRFFRPLRVCLAGIWESLAANLGLAKFVLELAVQREMEAVCAAERVGFKEVATLKDRVNAFWGIYQDVIILEIPVADRERWWTAKPGNRP